MIVDHLVEKDSRGFRRTFTSDIPRAQSHLIFLGCSYTFGEGVRDEETFPYRVSKTFPKVQTINMGRMGAGIEDQIYLWDSFDWSEVIQAPRGALVVTVIHDHLERLRKTWRYLGWANGLNPVYRLKDGQAIYGGLLEDTSKFKISQWVRSRGVELYWLRLMSWFQGVELEGAEEEFAAYVAALKAMYQKQFPQGEFYVAWMDIDHLSDPAGEAIFKAELSRRGVRYFDYAESPLKKFHLTHQELTIPRDGHPNSKGHALYADFLIEQLRSKAFPPAP